MKKLQKEKCRHEINAAVLSQPVTEAPCHVQQPFAVHEELQIDSNMCRDEDTTMSTGAEQNGSCGRKSNE